jgi:DNA replication and repair protein RecF
MRANGASVAGLIDVERRPLLSVFLPDRLELVKGPPALRRSHLDQFIRALWPVRSATRRAYAQALAQRNALLARIRSGRATAGALDPWDAQLAEHGIALRDNRAEAAALVSDRFATLASDLGLTGEAELRYRPRSRAVSATELVEELAERRASDLDRGFTGHGPHRDDLALLRDHRELRAFGSQGEQRLALLALLMAERGAIAAARSHPPLMLLDDVMSELDSDRRELLARLLVGAGQSVVTTTDLSHVPGAMGPGVSRVAVSSGTVLQEAQAA